MGTEKMSSVIFWNTSALMRRPISSFHNLQYVQWHAVCCFPEQILAKDSPGPDLEGEYDPECTGHCCGSYILSLSTEWLMRGNELECVEFKILVIFAAPLTISHIYLSELCLWSLKLVTVVTILEKQGLQLTTSLLFVLTSHFWEPLSKKIWSAEATSKHLHSLLNVSLR